MEAKQGLVNEICPTTTQTWIKRGALLVDVREPEEVTHLDFDVPAIAHIPLSEFEIRYKELPFNKELVLVCRSGARSLRAAGFLINNGYDPAKVVNMKHGIIRWVQRGFPTKGDVLSVVSANINTGCCGSSASKTTINKNPCCGYPDNDGSICC